MFDVSKIKRIEGKLLQDFLSFKIKRTPLQLKDLTYNTCHNRLEFWNLLVPGAIQYRFSHKRLLNKKSTFEFLKPDYQHHLQSGDNPFWGMPEVGTYNFDFKQVIIPNLKVSEPILITGIHSVLLSLTLESGERDFSVDKINERTIRIIDSNKNTFIGFIIKNENLEDLEKWLETNVTDKEQTKEDDEFEPPQDAVDLLIDNYEKNYPTSVDSAIGSSYVDENDEPDEIPTTYETMEQAQLNDTEIIIEKFRYGNWLLRQISKYQDRSKHYDERIVVSFMLKEEDLKILKRATRYFNNYRRKINGVTFSAGVDEVNNHFGVEKKSVGKEELIVCLIDDCLDKELGDLESKVFYSRHMHEFVATDTGGMAYFQTTMKLTHNQLDHLRYYNPKRFKDRTELLFQLPYAELFRMEEQDYGIDIYTEQLFDREEVSWSLSAKCYGRNGQVNDVSVFGFVDYTKMRCPDKTEKRLMTREEWLNLFSIRSDEQLENYNYEVKNYVWIVEKRNAELKERKDHTLKFCHAKRQSERIKFPQETEEEYAEYVKKNDEKYRADHETPYKWWVLDDYNDGGTSLSPIGWLKRGHCYYVKDKETYEKEIALTMTRMKLTREEVMERQEQYNEFGKFIEVTKENPIDPNEIDLSNKIITNDDLKELKALEKQVKAILKLQKKNN